MAAVSWEPSAHLSADAGALAEVVTRLRRVLRTSIRSEYPWESLPMAQVELLLALRERQPARIGELATRLKLAPNTISGLVQQLVEAALVSRDPDPADRRVATVTLTPAGSAKLDEWELAHHRRLSAALTELGSADQAAVRAALPALARLVEHLSDPPAAEPSGGRSGGAGVGDEDGR
ncbi:MAG TPA: MarR family transcriptional regulator [Pseudonocardia sp.]|jgi:DNA-binding MarR family transcriptional regulator|uniref:MarR family winged helix-turn-helix transcriptional regulator n=1 Tax=Pseudonocardia sp. TaxID=60912 RepID=UPI002B982DCF|nr:MarR family transcriptional regulator [Pseudonocardia sp.]HTF51833.1 MarR family transcriptional regulator [Pseudonocardia sp.]